MKTTKPLVHKGRKALPFAIPPLIGFAKVRDFIRYPLSFNGESSAPTYLPIKVSAGSSKGNFSSFLLEMLPVATSPPCEKYPEPTFLCHYF
jgi:hypothetical protein